jgi:cell cycle arrest protein BUB2
VVCTLRGRVWKALLAVNAVSADAYLGLVARGPSSVHEKIRSGAGAQCRGLSVQADRAGPGPGARRSNDGFRTFATDVHFKQRVSEDQLLRVLNAFAHRSGIRDHPLGRARLRRA